MEKTRIIGIDPGFDRIGVCILDKNRDREKVIFSCCILTNRKDSFEKRLFYVGKELEKLLLKYSPEEMAIESLFFAKNVTTAMYVAEVRGVCIYLSQIHNVKIFEYSPPQIKLAIAGHGKATKQDILNMIPKILKISIDKGVLDDELDAIAVSLTHSAHRKMSMVYKSE